MTYHVFKNYNGGEEAEELSFDFDGDMTHPDFDEVAQAATGFDRYFSSGKMNLSGPMIATLTDRNLNEVTVVAECDLEKYHADD